MEHTDSSFRTARLLIRRFRTDDWPGIQWIAIDKEASEGGKYDDPWPTSDEGCKGMAEFLSNDDRFWAVCLREDAKLIGLVAFNSIDKEKRLDLGHLFHREFAGGDYDAEAIERMVDHAFSSLDIRSIITRNAAAWEVQLAPLKKLGFAERSGVPVEMTREGWSRRSQAHQTDHPAGK